MSDLLHEVLLIRHGEAHCNTAGVIASTSCRGLTPTGRAQVLRLGHRLVDELVHGPVAALLTGPVRRAQETACMIGDLLGMYPCSHFDLRVPDPGQVEGHTWEEVRRELPPDPDRPTRPLIPGGEPWHRYLDRAHDFLIDILLNHPGGRIIVVGHSETVTALSPNSWAHAPSACSTSTRTRPASPASPPSPNDPTFRSPANAGH